MRCGFYLPTRGRTAAPEALETLVHRGEELGFHSVMIADHIVFDFRSEHLAESVERMERFAAGVMALAGG